MAVVEMVRVEEREGGMTTTAFTKLRSGDWGVRGPAAEIRQQAQVTVSKRNGERKAVTIGRIVWTDGATVVAAIEDSRQQRRHTHSRSRWCRCERPIDEGDGECMGCGHRLY